MEINKIYQGDSLQVLKGFPDESIDMVMTSPPYWALRDYGTEGKIWDAAANCQHEWGNEITTQTRGSWDNATVGNNKKGLAPKELKQGNYCQKCGAWRGNLGLEPTFDLYIKHLCNIYDEVKRVLKDEGTIWINIGDTYAGSSQGAGGSYELSKKQNSNRGSHFAKDNGEKSRVIIDLPDKCLCQIPSRFAIEMTNPNWVLRDDISEQDKLYVLTELVKRGII